MKKTIGVLLAGFLLAGAGLVAGCGGSSSTQSSDAVTQSTDAMAQGGAAGGTVTEPDLTNVPIYPGAEKETMTAGGAGGAGGTPPSGTSGSGSNGTMPTPPSGGTGGTPPSGGTAPSMSMVRYTTTDSADTVIAWYRGQLSSRDGFAESTGTFGPQGDSGSGATQTTFSFENGDTIINIMIGTAMQGQSGTSSGTSIMISEGAMPAQPSS